MKKLLCLLFVFLFATLNTVFAGCCYLKNIKRCNGPKFKLVNSEKKGFKSSGGNMGIHRGLNGQYIGTYKIKGKRTVAYDREGHRISYCKYNSQGRAIQYNRSGRAVGYCASDW